jgi:hypothetical protein
MVCLLVAAFLLGFYMDWFGLWASKNDMRAQIARSKETRRHANAQFEEALNQITRDNDGPGRGPSARTGQGSASL